MFGLVWFVVNEKRGKQDSLNHNRMTMDISSQKALQEWLHTIHNLDSLEKQCIAAIMNYSALSNVEHENP
jgi:hypothetical protein